MSVRHVVIAAICYLGMQQALAQPRIDLEAYKAYREARKDMTLEQLYQEFPAGRFLPAAPTDIHAANHFPEISTKYALTLDERSLLERNSFMVTERLSFADYHLAYYDGYRQDLPVYISSDAVLHALHRTYSNVLQDLEKSVFVHQLRTALDRLQLSIAQEGALSDPLARQARADVDVYVGVAHALINGRTSASTFNDSCRGAANEVLAAIYAGRPASLTTFTQQARAFDFSQLKPRGHYAGSAELEQYFRTMMWLGRTEIYITAPSGVVPPALPEDVARQCRMAVDLGRLIRSSGADTLLGTIETVLARLIGDQDNISTSKLNSILDDLQLTPSALSDAASCKPLQDAVVAAGGAQQILSQILINGDDGAEITPAASYLVMGQRFLFDSFILANVVYDNVRAVRMMPDPQDVLFALGNDASAQLLESEIGTYRYAENLAALRFLTNSLDTSYWNSSMYTSWLRAIRSLNPPRERSSLPMFMQTAAWWQKSMSTQLASWTELRHDNLLYGKQSYSGGLGCYYPAGYVEPVPDVYRAVGMAATNLKSALNGLKPHQVMQMMSTLVAIETTMTTLASIAEKELSGVGTPLDSTERDVLDGWLTRTTLTGKDCVMMFTGYFPKLFYRGNNEHAGRRPDIVTADVHTQPTDEQGENVGRILHVGTGLVNMAVVIAKDPSDGCATAYVGPVSSFYQHFTRDFKRMTDQEWQATLEQDAQSRPMWTRLYLADRHGDRRDGDAPSLLVTSVDTESTTTTTDVGVAPNPATSATLISLTMASYAADAHITLHDGQGAMIATLHRGGLEGGTHVLRWDGRDASGRPVASGTYHVRAVANGQVTSAAVVISR